MRTHDAGPKGLKNVRGRESNIVVHCNTYTHTQLHPKYTCTHKPMKDGSTKQWERVPLVYFLWVPNAGLGGGPQLNHSRHAVGWEATTLTSLKEAIDTHTHKQGITKRQALNQTHTHVQHFSGQDCHDDRSVFKKQFEVKGQICMGCFPQCFARQLHNPINVVTTAQLGLHSKQTVYVRVRDKEDACTLLWPVLLSEL